MNFFDQIIHELGRRISTRIGASSDLGTIGKEYLKHVEDGRLRRAEGARPRRAYRDSKNNDLTLHNQKDFAGFHVIESIKPVKDGEFSGTSINFKVEMRMLIFGKAGKNMDWIWLLPKCFQECSLCEDGSRGNFTLKEINTHSDTIINRYAPESMESLISGQFNIDLIELTYTVIATNCKC